MCTVPCIKGEKKTGEKDGDCLYHHKIVVVCFCFWFLFFLFEREWKSSDQGSYNSGGIVGAIAVRLNWLWLMKQASNQAFLFLEDFYSSVHFNDVITLRACVGLSRANLLRSRRRALRYSDNFCSHYVISTFQLNAKFNKLTCCITWREN